MLDFEHKKIFYSETFVDLNETNLDYYHKKLEKTLYASTKKELTVGTMHELMLRSDKMLESDEEFMKQAHDITNQLFSLGSLIQDMPNSNILFVDCLKEGQKYIVIMKLNYRTIPMSVVDEGIVRITKQQVLPTAGAQVDEAIMINTDTKQLYLIEKKFMIDGKSDYYLNPQWIKGEEKLTDKQKLNTMKKVIRQMDDLYNVSDGKALPLMKQEIQDKVVAHEPIHPIEIAKTVLKNDYQAQEESELMLKDLGIGDQDTIQALPNSMETCKLLLDEDIEVTLSIDEYLNGDKIEKRKESDGTYSFIVKNINEVIVK